MPNELKHYGVKGMKWDPSKKTGKTYEELLKEKRMTTLNNNKMSSRTMTDEEYAEYKKRVENKSSSQTKTTDTKPNDRHNLSVGATGKAGVDAFLIREKERKAKAKLEQQNKEAKKKELISGKAMSMLKGSLRNSANKVSVATRSKGKTYAQSLLSKSRDTRKVNVNLKQKRESSASKSTELMKMYDLLKQKTTTK